MESIAVELAFVLGEDAIAEFGSLADEGGESFGGSVEGEVDAHEALESLEAFFGVVGDREDFFRLFVVSKGFEPFGSWGCAIGMFPMGITERSFEDTVTEWMTIRRTIGQTNDEACDLTIVASLAKFGMLVVKICRTLIENDG